MDLHQNPKNLIVVGFDDSPESELALEWAANEAAWRGSELEIVHALDALTGNQLGALASAGISPTEIRAEMDASGREVLRTAEKRVRSRHQNLVLRSSLRTGDARTELMDAGHDADLVVIGSRGRGPVKSLLLGSVGLALVRHSSSPVAVIRGDSHGNGGIAVGVDTKNPSDELLRTALTEAAWRKAPLSVVIGTWDVEIRGGWFDAAHDDVYCADRAAAAEHLVAQLRREYPDVEVAVRVVRGHLDRALVDIADQSSLMILGRRGASPLDHVGLGSITTTVVEHAHRPVLVVPQRTEDRSSEEVGDHESVSA